MREGRGVFGLSSACEVVVADGKRTRELFRLADPGQGITVEVEVDEVGVGGRECFRSAHLVLESGFVSGRLSLVLSFEDLRDWAHCLDALQFEERIAWPKGDRTAWLEVHPADPLVVTVYDAPATQVAVRMPVDIPEECWEENRLRWEEVRRLLGL